MPHIQLSNEELSEALAEYMASATPSAVMVRLGWACSIAEARAKSADSRKIIGALGAFVVHMEATFRGFENEAFSHSEAGRKDGRESIFAETLAGLITAKR